MSMKQAPTKRLGKRFFALLITFVLLTSTTLPALAQVRVSGAVGGKAAAKKKSKKPISGKAGKEDASDEIIPEQLSAAPIAMKTTAEIMGEQAAWGVYKTTRELLRESGVARKKKTYPDRRNLP